MLTKEEQMILDQINRKEAKRNSRNFSWFIGLFICLIFDLFIVAIIYICAVGPSNLFGIEAEEPTYIIAGE